MCVQLLQIVRSTYGSADNSVHTVHLSTTRAEAIVRPCFVSLCPLVDASLDTMLGCTDHSKRSDHSERSGYSRKSDQDRCRSHDLVVNPASATRSVSAKPKVSGVKGWTCGHTADRPMTSTQVDYCPLEGLPCLDVSAIDQTVTDSVSVITPDSMQTTHSSQRVGVKTRSNITQNTHTGTVTVNSNIHRAIRSNGVGRKHRRRNSDETIDAMTQRHDTSSDVMLLSDQQEEHRLVELTKTRTKMLEAPSPVPRRSHRHSPVVVSCGRPKRKKTLHREPDICMALSGSETFTQQPRRTRQAAEPRWDVGALCAPKRQRKLRRVRKLYTEDILLPAEDTQVTAAQTNGTSLSRKALVTSRADDSGDRPSSRTDDSRDRPSSRTGDLGDRPSSRTGDLGDRPSSRTGDLGDRPSSRTGDLGDRPSSRTGDLGDRPSSRTGDLGDRPSSRTDDSRDRPSSRTGDLGDRPSGRTGDLGDRPSSRTGDLGDRPSSRTGDLGDRPSSRTDDSRDRPSSRTGDLGDRPSSRTGDLGDRPSSRTGDLGDRPSSRTGDLGDRPSSRTGDLGDRPSSRTGDLRDRPSSRTGDLGDRPSSRTGDLGDRPSSRTGDLGDRPSSRTGDLGDRPAQTNDTSLSRKALKERTEGTDSNSQPHSCIIISSSPEHCTPVSPVDDAVMSSGPPISSTDHSDSVASTQLDASAVQRLEVRPLSVEGADVGGYCTWGANSLVGVTPHVWGPLHVWGCLGGSACGGQYMWGCCVGGQCMWGYCMCGGQCMWGCCVWGSMHVGLLHVWGSIHVGLLRVWGFHQCESLYLQE